MRILPYKCPKDTRGYGCLYDMDNDICTNCGVSYDDLQTIWDKIEDVYHTVIPYEYRPKNLYRSFKDRFFNKWTTIKPRTLGHGWCDYSHLVPEMIFEMNSRFVEKEVYREIKEEKDWEWQKEHNPEFYRAWMELVRIHRWWITLPLDGPEFYTDPVNKKGWDLEAEEAFAVLTRNNCKSVIDNSPWMWT